MLHDEQKGVFTYFALYLNNFFKQNKKILTTLTALNIPLHDIYILPFSILKELKNQEKTPYTRATADIYIHINAVK